MKALKNLDFAIVVTLVLAWAVTATSAMATELPDLHVALGESYPLLGEGEIKGEPAAKLESALKEPLTATTVKAKLELKELSSLGVGVITYTGVKHNAAGCNTEGDAPEVVKLSGEGHIVVKVVAGKLTPLLLLLFKPLTFACEKLKLIVSGTLVLNISKVVSGMETTEVGTQSKCVGAGKQEFTEYENDAGEIKTKQLILTNFGLGNEPACEEYFKELVIKSNKMAELLF
ncbi:MAG TPA: hypothetical protein VHW67_09720 [Solirubrobacteraceae bacterium]|jgi:hypothetical protein|nr:hypothetical protein [Solirubrobacteraceae bacterium]